MHEVLIFGMPPDIARDERVERDHAEPLRAGILQSGMGKLAPDAAPLKCLGHFGVDQDDVVPTASILDDRDLAVHAYFELLRGLVVLDFVLTHVPPAKVGVATNVIDGASIAYGCDPIMGRVS